MPSPLNNYFLDTIRHLRRQEEVVIYDRYAPITTDVQESVTAFLKEEYERECLEYPNGAPDFDGAAALWAARTIYITAQFLLYREKTGTETSELLPSYGDLQTPGAILSADLCLRFLPDILEKAREISLEDPLIMLLEKHLYQWHFSGVGYPLHKERLDWPLILESDCVRKLYVDRIIQRRSLSLTGIPVLQTWIKAALGDHGSHYWKEYNKEYDPY